MPESPVFLANKKMHTEASEAYNQIFSINNQSPLSNQEKKIIRKLNPIVEKTSQAVIWSQEYLKTTLIMIFYWFTAGFIYFSIIYQLPQIFLFDIEPEDQIKKGLFTVVGQSIFANVLAILIIQSNHVGRIKGLQIGFILLLFCMFFCCYLQFEYIFLLFITTSRICGACIYILLIIYSFEIYPTNIRAMGASVVYSFYFLGAILAPLFMNYFDLIDFHFGFFLCFCLALIAVAVNFGLEIETSNMPIDTIDPKETEKNDVPSQ